MNKAVKKKKEISFTYQTIDEKTQNGSCSSQIAAVQKSGELAGWQWLLLFQCTLRNMVSFNKSQL